MKVVITGGHLTPALAVIEELKKGQSEIHFIGRLYSMEGDNTPSVESKVIADLQIPFYPLTTGRLQRRLTRFTFVSLAKVPFGFWQAYRYLKKIQPDVVLSFGGYLALPVVVVAKLMNIRVVTHEQTVVFGMSNKIISKFADKIAVSWPNSVSYFPADKVVLTGNPIRKELLSIRRRLSVRPTLYFTGGNQGAHVINQAVFEILSELLEIFDVVHQTGSAGLSQDYERSKSLKNELSKVASDHYNCKEWFDTQELKNILAKVTLVISRSGANTVTELAALGIPSVLIPIPWVAQDEQTKNALVLSEAGSAIILRQKELTSKKLFTTIQLALENLDQLEKHAKIYKKSFKTNAAEKIAQLVRQVAAHR
ncbi:MAG: hypothetical protein A3F33_01535 [Candidatus Woykebacteria bacterium RIFCSPHIGHO2_12_FULL_43_10]|uniref:UDP-N-acetylglucosamine--N-acetylmuramyl-(pentapeptide) pyrophosphoryl-undecaprenol N-acetylglucosamine transferase n=2 Tax=Candidatus Woykeibacteriota TaxID=1817899 RepID=A0A1G1WY93_9BACT|nr:MAG: hypothetical protein A2802_01035 [Candidatus Woykebacteria bacterium RIFCSPHIGHO2_01_FULL_43_29]OGY29136.1 MAG: hypothetical protein A3F33_01535 [Candidatus Woykebacteria bacterium RIFCSPHIGHO2_12_FULL_43_10]OGY30135.1 MAG: hypothetical protein A3J50_04245 [Candidatus Woykebacteria bacterium RIFCSPHIGHO2_02_FULL_43_16b]OGY32699.1 MAG: hypothetical protein A3A61_00915 [Candidatus Woykebacteria bacterium RIFCSPLOWO2_01_FULL_43_14]